MSRILTVKVSDQAYIAIQQQAENIGVPAEQFAATLLEQRLLSSNDVAKAPAQANFERHFGALSVESIPNLDNATIDTDDVNTLATDHH